MHRLTFQSFFDELKAIEKDAGVKDVLKTVKAVPEKAKRLGVRAIHHPHVAKIINHVTDPSNTSDIANSLASLASKLT